MDSNTVTTLALNAFGTGLSLMGLIIVLINLVGTQGYSFIFATQHTSLILTQRDDLFGRKKIQAICLGTFANVMTIIGSNDGSCSPIWSRLNNICWGFTKVFFTEVSLIRFEMVTPDYPYKARTAVRVVTAIWYLAWLLVIQVNSSFYGCQMVYDLMPLYPVYCYQLLVDVVTSFRFLYVFYSLRWHRKEMNWISLIVDLCVLATIIASLAEVVILLTELPQPIEKIDFKRILFSGTTNFIISGALYTAMSVYGKMEKSPKKTKNASNPAGSTTSAQESSRKQTTKNQETGTYETIQSTARYSTVNTATNVA